MTSTSSALLAAILAGGIAGALVASFASGPSNAAAPGGDVVRLRPMEAPPGEALLKRLAILEKRVDEVELTPVPATAPERSRSQSDLRAVEARLAQIEASVKTMDAVNAKRMRERNAQLGLTSAAPAARRERMTAEDARWTILDPAADEEAKINAWAALRREQAWGDDVVDEMIRVAQTSTDAEVRANVWRKAHGTPRNARLVGPMIDSLRHDSVAQVREEAAETLGHYLSEPGVVAALQAAVKSDANRKVRDQAEETLEGKK